MPDTNIGSQIGRPHSRIDGPAKVRGQATYAGEFNTAQLAHGYVIGSRIARGRITSIDATAALAMPGVLTVLTHENRPRTAWTGKSYQDDVAPPGSPFRALYDEHVHYSGQPVALVVAEDFDLARDAATLVRIEYEAAPHETDLSDQRDKAQKPGKVRSGIKPPPKPRGDAKTAMAASAVRIEAEYTHPAEHHNPMEPHASTVIWQEDGSLLVHDKIQGVQNSQRYVQNVFGRNDVRVVSPFVGGAFGSGLRPHYQLFLAVLAATELKRSVRVVLTRDQMFTFTHRPETINHIALGASNDGKLQALRHDVIATTSRYEEYQEVVANWSGLLYGVENAEFSYKIAPLDIATPGDMRAPGAPTGHFAIESAMDELANTLGIDPVALRLLNDTDKDLNEGKPWSSRELRAAIDQGAERFGWSRRTSAPRSMREGRELIGWGMAIGAWDAMMQETAAKAVLLADGTLEVSSATADIGTGTYTILAQIAAETMGLPMDRVRVLIGDSDLPTSPVEGGSWTAASAGMAVQTACEALREQILVLARDSGNLPDAQAGSVMFDGGRVAMGADASRSADYRDLIRSAGLDRLQADGKGMVDKAIKKGFSSYTHSACFVEVRVDEQLGVIRVTRIVSAVAAGRILNPKTARSQVMGGVVFGMGMALYEETMADHTLGRFMNHNFAEYHVPAHADMPEIDVIFVDEQEKMNPLGVKGLGEIGIVATPAAIANAIHHATGVRVRNLPITIDKILTGQTAPS